MKDLLQIQTHFQEYLLHASPQIAEYVVSTEKVPAQLRLDIYTDAYRSRLLESLETTYPTLSTFMGDDNFKQMGLEYINKFPSGFKSIRWFGDCLANFLSEHVTYKNTLYLSELALVEWTMTLAFDAADAPILTLEEIGKIPPDAWATMHLYAHPSLQRIKLSWNAVQIWQTIVDEQTLVEPVQSPHPIEWIFWRHELMNQFCSVTESEAWAIDALLSGANFGDICEGICQWIAEENAAIYAATLLKSWVTAGIITRVENESY